MDMFMDKLAQKLTAQEIIKANTTAEAEELNRLRNQIDEYDQCLARLRQLIEDGSARLEEVHAGGGESDRMAELTGEKVSEAIRQNMSELERLQEQLTERLTSVDKSLAERLEDVDKNLSERFDEADRKLGERLGNVNRIMGERFESMDKALDERLEDMDGALEERLENLDSTMEQRFAGLSRSVDEKLGKLGEQPDEQLEDRFSAMSDSVHRECVKVYRNVQAVVLEESNKQKLAVNAALNVAMNETLNENLNENLNGALNRALSGTVTGVQRMGKKLDTVFGISLVALLLSLVGVVMQIMNLL